MNIVFLQSQNPFEISPEIPASYKQIKSYLLHYSQFKASISICFCKNIAEMPEQIDIIGVSSLSQNFNEAIMLGKDIRERYPDALLILGGHHISYFPETLPKEYDAGVLFEGEQTFLEIVDMYISSKNRTSLLSLKGIVCRDHNGNININPANELIDPLDKMPLPVLEGQEAPYIFTSRGCPYSCSFCFSTQFWRKFRMFSVDYVISFIENILNSSYHLENMVIWDDLLIADRKRFADIVGEIEKRKINQKINFTVMVRANLIDDEICRLLKKMNVYYAAFGAESGSDRILRLLKGNSVNTNTNQKAIDLFHKYGISCACSFIAGCPSETEKELQQTYGFICKNLADGKMLRGIINVLMPLPGTKMWQFGVDNNIIKEPIDWNRMKVFASYQDSRFKDVVGWAEQRIKDNSYYLNEETIPHEKFLEILCGYETELRKVKTNYSKFQQ